MADTLLPGPSAPIERPPDDRLDSWKEIAAYMKRDATTVQRWEKREDMPVHRHIHDKLGSVYAYRSELDAWTRNRRPAHPEGVAEHLGRSTAGRRSWLRPAAAVGAVLVLAIAVWQLQSGVGPVDNPVTDGRFLQLTDFDGIEQAAALSRDGRLAAFQSDRDGGMDIWVTEVGSGRFQNLTRGTVHDVVNPSVRTLGFSPDGPLVTFWPRKLGGSPREISVWGLPVLGGPWRRCLDGVADFDWSEDGCVVYP